jgi:hypothetical protein
MKNHDIFIEITPKGEVRAEIRGVKGPGCLQYAKLLQEIVGSISQQELTAEYYEPDEGVTLQQTDNIQLDQSR